MPVDMGNPWMGMTTMLPQLMEVQRHKDQLRRSEQDKLRYEFEKEQQLKRYAQEQEQHEWNKKKNEFMFGAQQEEYNEQKDTKNDEKLAWMEYINPGSVGGLSPRAQQMLQKFQRDDEQYNINNKLKNAQYNNFIRPAPIKDKTSITYRIQSSDKNPFVTQDGSKLPNGYYNITRNRAGEVVEVKPYDPPQSRDNSLGRQQERTQYKIIEYGMAKDRRIQSAENNTRKTIEKLRNGRDPKLVGPEIQAQIDAAWKRLEDYKQNEETNYANVVRSLGGNINQVAAVNPNATRTQNSNTSTTPKYDSNSLRNELLSLGK